MVGTYAMLHADGGMNRLPALLLAMADNASALSLDTNTN